MFDLIKPRTVTEFPPQVCDRERTPTSLWLKLPGKMGQIMIIDLDCLTITTSEINSISSKLSMKVSIFKKMKRCLSRSDGTLIPSKDIRWARWVITAMLVKSFMIWNPCEKPYLRAPAAVCSCLALASKCIYRASEPKFAFCSRH
jgi:hypothetical protein